MKARKRNPVTVALGKELNKKVNELIRLRRKFQNIIDCKQKNWADDDWNHWDRFYAKNRRGEYEIKKS